MQRKHPKDIFFFTYYEEASRWAVKKQYNSRENHPMFFSPPDLINKRRIGCCTGQILCLI